MGKDRAGQAHCRARLEIALAFAGGGACEAWRIAYNGSDRIVRAGYPLCPSALPFLKGLSCPSLRRPPSPMSSTMHRRSAARACLCWVCNTCLRCSEPRCSCPCSQAFPFRRRFCSPASARYCFIFYRAVRCPRSWAHRLPLLPVMLPLRRTARPSYCLTLVWALPAPACSIRCSRRSSVRLVPSASCASSRRLSPAPSSSASA